MPFPSESRRNALLGQGVELLYDSLVSPEKLQPALVTLKQSIEATAACFIRVDQHGNLCEFEADGFDPDARRVWIEYYNTIDPGRGMLSNGVGEWFWDDVALSPTQSPQPEYVHDFALRHGIRYMRGGRMHEDEGGHAVLSFHQPPDARGFDDPLVRHVLEHLRPHVARVVRLCREMERAGLNGHCAAAALDQLACGVAVVNSLGMLRYANRSAEALLRRRGPLCTQFGRLSGRTAQTAELLREALRRAFVPPRQASAFQGEASDQNGVHVRVVPLSDDHILSQAAREPLAMVYFAHPPGQVSASDLQSLFGLTAAEAQVAVLLASGVSPEECGRLRGTRISTVRAQLRSVYAKSGVQSQAQFVAMARCLPITRE